LPGVTWLLRASVALNALLGLALARRLRRRALILRGRIAPPESDFAAASHRFAALEPGSVVLVGDSHVEHGPWLEVLTSYRNRGISGAKIASVSAWIDDVLASDPAQLVLMIGSNDVYFCEPHKTSAAAARDLFARIAATARCPVTVVSIPPLPADKRAVDALNKALAELSAQHGFQWVDIRPPLAAMDWTIDGLHLTADAYRAVAPVLTEALKNTKKISEQN
jgi:lysophospholipase L1-like esterase